MSKFHRFCSCIKCREIIIIQNIDVHYRSKHDHKSVLGNCKLCNIALYNKNMFCTRSCATKYNNQRRSFKPGPKKGIVRESKQSLYTKISQCVICNKFHPRKAKTCSDRCFIKHLSNQTKGKTGGWRNFGGNGQKGIYEGFVYQSSWELAWIIYHIDKKIPFRRCEEFFYYEYDGKTRKYIPDFYLIKDQTYIEIKGFWSEKTSAKISSVINSGYKINVLTKKEIKQYIDYKITNASIV